MAYVIAFDNDPSEIEEKLANNIHVINLETGNGVSKSDALVDFFHEIQEFIDIAEGARLRASRPEVFESLANVTFERSAKESDASSLFTSSSNLCFVMMPFRSNLDSLYADLIKPVAEQFGLSVMRADEIFSPGSITEQIRVAIQQSRLCVADVTHKNPNVLYEVGIAHTLGKPTLLLTRNIEDVPFDLRALRLIVYEPDQIQAARLNLERAIQSVLGEDQIEEAERLLNSGMYRAAAAVLGVFLEHILRQLQAKYAHQLDTRSGKRPLGIGPAMKLLADSGIIEAEDIQPVHRATEIRNRAVHDLTEPTAQDVQFMLRVVREFKTKYLG